MQLFLRGQRLSFHREMSASNPPAQVEAPPTAAALEAEAVQAWSDYFREKGKTTPPCFRKFASCVKVNCDWIAKLKGVHKGGALHNVLRHAQSYYAKKMDFKITSPNRPSSINQLLEFARNAATIIASEDSKRQAKEKRQSPKKRKGAKKRKGEKNGQVVAVEVVAASANQKAAQPINVDTQSNGEAAAPTPPPAKIVRIAATPEEVSTQERIAAIKKMEAETALLQAQKHKVEVESRMHELQQAVNLLSQSGQPTDATLIAKLREIIADAVNKLGT